MKRFSGFGAMTMALNPRPGRGQISPSRPERQSGNILLDLQRVRREGSSHGARGICRQKPQQP